MFILNHKKQVYKQFMDSQNNSEARQKGFYIKRLGLEDNGQTKIKGIRKTARQCAKDARERKKAYVNKIEIELEETKLKLQSAEEEISNLQQIVSGYGENRKKSEVDEGFEGLMIEFQRLYTNLKTQNTTEITRSLSFLRDKYGISGRERIKNIDSILDRLVGVIMPMHYRLLMENSTKNKEFYQLFGPRKNQGGLVKFNEFEREVLLKVRPKINKQKKQYDQILMQLAQVRDKIRKQNIECQSIVDEIEDKLSPTYVATLLVDLDCRRSRSGLDQAYPLNFWADAKAGLITQTVSSGQAQNNYDSLLNYQFDQQILNELFT